MPSDILICSAINTVVLMTMYVLSGPRFYPISQLLSIYRFRALVSLFYFSHTFYFDLTARKGAVVLSGFINAARLSSSAAGTPLIDQRILFFGAGSAGIGVAKQLMSFFTLLGLSEEEAKSRIYVSNQGSLLFLLVF